VSWPGLARPPTTCDADPAKFEEGEAAPRLYTMVGGRAQAIDPSNRSSFWLQG